VLDLLDGQAAQTDWFRDQVSFRLGYTARRLAAMARGEAAAAADALTRARTLAERLGITVSNTLPGLDEASLDIDV
jgi:hypothetical protein